MTERKRSYTKKSVMPKKSPAKKTGLSAVPDGKYPVLGAALSYLKSVIILLDKEDFGAQGMQDREDLISLCVDIATEYGDDIKRPCKEIL